MSRGVFVLKKGCSSTSAELRCPANFETIWSVPERKDVHISVEPQTHVPFLVSLPFIKTFCHRHLGLVEAFMVLSVFIFLTTLRYGWEAGHELLLSNAAGSFALQVWATFWKFYPCETCQSQLWISKSWHDSAHGKQLRPLTRLLALHDRCCS